MGELIFAFVVVAAFFLVGMFDTSIVAFLSGSSDSEN